MAKYFDRPENFLLLFLKTVYQYILTLPQYLFFIKQANKICILLSAHFWALKYNFRSYASVTEWYIF